MKRARDAPVADSEISYVGTGYVRKRSGSLSLPSTPKEYVIQLKSSSSAATARIAGARVLVVDDVSSGWTTGEEEKDIGQSWYGTITTTGLVALSDRPIFLYEAGKYDGAITAYFEAILFGNTAGVTYTIYLYDLTTGTEVTHVSTTATTPTRVRSGAITLINGHEYYAYAIRVSQANVTIYVPTCKIIIQQSGSIRKTQLHKKTFFYGLRNSTTPARYTRDFLLDEGNLPPKRTYYHEATLRCASGGLAQADIFDLTDGVSLPGSLISTTSTSYVRLRSGPLSPTNLHEYDERDWSGVSGVYMYIAAGYFIIDVELEEV